MQGGATVDELGRRPLEPQIAFDQNPVHKCGDSDVVFTECRTGLTALCIRF
jgi:hypothetical protein